MSAVLCLPACLCVSAAASRGQAPHGNASLGHLACDLANAFRGALVKSLTPVAPETKRCTTVGSLKMIIEG